jgi:hypothetical protein
MALIGHTVPKHWCGGRNSHFNPRHGCIRGDRQVFAGR